MTPNNRSEANQALQALQSGEEHARTVRQLFIRTATKIKKLRVDLTVDQEELKKLRALVSVRKRKLPGMTKGSPNNAFATLQDLLGSQIPPSVANTATTVATIGQIGQEHREGEVQDHVDAFSAIANNLSSIAFL